jgi:hypothetical protein
MDVDFGWGIDRYVDILIADHVLGNDRAKDRRTAIAAIDVASTAPLASPAACACPSPCPHSTNHPCASRNLFSFQNPDFHHGLLGNAPIELTNISRLTHGRSATAPARLRVPPVFTRYKSALISSSFTPI